MHSPKTPTASLGGRAALTHTVRVLSTTRADGDDGGSDYRTMMVIEVWLLGGPADGRIMPVEVAPRQDPPQVIDLPQTGVFVGSSDTPAPMVTHRYRLADPDCEPVTYRYHGAVPPQAT